jgi:hypothetical protein
LSAWRATTGAAAGGQGSGLEGLTAIRLHRHKADTTRIPESNSAIVS